MHVSEVKRSTSCILSAGPPQCSVKILETYSVLLSATTAASTNVVIMTVSGLIHKLRKQREEPLWLGEVIAISRLIRAAQKSRACLCVCAW